MLRKLRAESDVYDSTCLVLAEWPAKFGGVILRNDATPPDLQADQFLASMITAVLDRTPVTAHVHARERHEHRVLAVTELDETSEGTGED